MSKVSLVRTSDRTDGVRRVIALLDVNPVKEKAVVLKPNFNSADRTPGSTHIETLRALVQNLKEMGAKSITLAERSGPGDSTHTVMEKKGIFQLADELGFDILDLQAMGPRGQPLAGWIPVPQNIHGSRMHCANLLFKNARLRRPFHPVTEEFSRHVTRRKSLYG